MVGSAHPTLLLQRPSVKEPRSGAFHAPYGWGNYTAAAKGRPLRFPLGLQFPFTYRLSGGRQLGFVEAVVIREVQRFFVPQKIKDVW